MSRTEGGEVLSDLRSSTSSVDDKYFGEDAGPGSEDRGRHGDARSNTYPRNRNGDATGPLYIEKAPANYIDAMVLQQAEVDASEVLVVSDASATQIQAAWDAYDALGAVVPERIMREPAGSRGDVLQSATWVDGVWTTEYQRDLETGNDDDVQFDDLSATYLLSAAIFDNGGGSSHNIANTLIQMTFEEAPTVFVPTARTRAFLTATVTNAGQPVVGALVAFSRSVSGLSPDYRWEGTTDEEGVAEVEIEVTERRGASGYYLAKATDPASGDIIGRWGSIPINAGRELTVLLPVGGRASVKAGGQLALSLSNHPNPFNPETQIVYDIPESGEVLLVIYNSMGQEIRVLTRGRMESGRHQVQWDGTDAGGRAVSSGIYFYRIVALGQTATRRMLLLK